MRRAAVLIGTATLATLAAVSAPRAMASPADLPGGGGCNLATIGGAPAYGDSSYTARVKTNPCGDPVRAWVDCYYTGSRANVISTPVGNVVSAVGATSTADCQAWKIYGNYGFEEKFDGSWHHYVLGNVG